MGCLAFTPADAALGKVSDGILGILSGVARILRSAGLRAFCDRIVVAVQREELDYLRHAYGLEATLPTPGTCRHIGQMYGVHRSTLFAWLDSARAKLVEHVRGVLALRVPGDQLESVVGSRLQLSVRRMLDLRLETE